jgi:hypothetical protein
MQEKFSKKLNYFGGARAAEVLRNSGNSYIINSIIGADREKPRHGGARTGAEGWEPPGRKDEGSLCGILD